MEYHNLAVFHFLKTKDSKTYKSSVKDSNTNDFGYNFFKKVRKYSIYSAFRLTIVGNLKNNISK